MASLTPDVVEDPENLLEQEDHMRDMERVEMEVIAITYPSPSIGRVTGRIFAAKPEAWAPANLAVRIEVETPEGQRPITRIYTIRSFDPVREVAEIDFVLHPDDTPAMRWLQAARPGTRVSMIGPRQHFTPNLDSGKRAAIFADDTAIPAVYAILKAWPEGARGNVWIDTDDRAAFDALPAVPGVGLHLLLRGPDQPAGTTGQLFTTAKADLTDPAGWTIWAAGERQEMRDIRAHFRALGYGRDDLRIFGYWKRGTSSSDIDRQRLRAYSNLRKRGLTMEALDDDDLAV